MKFILSIGPHATKQEGVFQIHFGDDAVQKMLIAYKYNGELADLTRSLRTLFLLLATCIGGVTATGSMVAYGKLSGALDSAPLSLQGRDKLNLAMLTTCAVGIAVFFNPGLLDSIDPGTLQPGCL